jgi:hypothetical protein
MPGPRLPIALLCAAVLLSVSAGWANAPAARAADPTSSAGALEEPPPLEREEISNVPDAPTHITVVPGDGSLQVAWTDPQVDGGNRALAYDVVATPQTAGLAAPAVVTTAGDTFGVLIPSLINGLTYDVAVTAENEAGSSSPAVAVATPRTVPNAPAVRSVTAGDGSARVSWTPPSDNGGAPVSSYLISSEPSGAAVTVDSAATTVRVSSLKNGVATTFTVTASNAAGNGPPSNASAPVTPRGVARIVVRGQPARRVVYGTPSRVRATLVAKTGEGVPRQRMELLAKVRPSTRWRRVATGFTGTRGRVTFRTTLPASAKLRLKHPAGVVAAPDEAVRSVVVAKRVIVTKGQTRTRLGRPVIARGRIAPAQRAGSRVRLERRVSGSWKSVATGRMVTRERYRIRWNPPRVGRYVLRVVKSGDRRHAAGRSRRWHHRVAPETAADIAKDILRNDRITLATVHVSGGGYYGSAHDNIVDVANGRRARHSCHAGAPCGSTGIDIRLLHAVRDMGTRGKMTVSEIAGGVHAGRSAHYSGRGVDITWVDSHHVGWGANYEMVLKRCRAYRATEIFWPTNDPYGGHHNHVHCAWE